MNDEDPWYEDYEEQTMKKGTAAIASAVLIAGTAHAQSSVTLYGLIDTGILYANNQQGASNWALNSATVNTPRWGLRGREDLGGGLSAIFWLESGFNSVNGTFRNSGSAGPDLFGRQAAVGIDSKQYGSLTLGRQYDFMVTYLQPLSAAGAGFGGNLATHPYDNDNIDNDMRLNNTVKFNSASFGGLKVGALYGFSNQAGGFSNDSAYSAGATYSYGSLNLAAAYLQINRSATSIANANASGAASLGDADALTTGGRQQIFGAGAQYMFGQSSVGLLYTHSVTDNVVSLYSGGNATATSSYINGGAASKYIKFDNFEINGRYFVRPNLSLGASYTFTMGELGAATGKTKPHWNQVMAQVDYLLSTRTDVYLAGTYQTVGGGNGMSIFNAGISTFARSSTNTQVVVGAGIRHRF
jgi:GBP family porin